jgi:hypothetical protein
VPISVRAERLGVLDVTLTEAPDAKLLETLGQLVIVLGNLLPAAHNYTHIVERARRERPMELPAEMQWSMLPVRAYSCGPFSLAGQLVPAYEVGGDLFDYAVQTDGLFVTVIDAMGHGLRASLLGTLAVTALRNARRTGLALADQLRQAGRGAALPVWRRAIRHRAGDAHRHVHRRGRPRSSTPAIRRPTSCGTGRS